MLSRGLWELLKCSYFFRMTWNLINELFNAKISWRGTLKTNPSDAKTFWYIMIKKLICEYEIEWLYWIWILGREFTTRVCKKNVKFYYFPALVILLLLLAKLCSRVDVALWISPIRSFIMSHVFKVFLILAVSSSW